MKNQYYGDINDYRKYGLLRQFCETFQNKIGLIWMLTDNDINIKDGNKTNYLDNPHKWKDYDPYLFEQLDKRLQRNERDVKFAEEDKIIPYATYFRDAFVSDITQRNNYLSSAVKKCNDCHIIFLDPDNGLEVDSVRKGSPKSEKYLYWDEFKAIYDHNKEYIIFQHYNLSERRNTLQVRLADKLKTIASSKEIVSLSTAYVAFIYLADSKEKVFNLNFDLFKKWNDQFDLRILSV
jgi:hypothetical protein